MDHNKRVEVNIDGMKFFVTGNNNEEYIKKIAKNLDEKIRETSKSNFRLNQVQTLTLVALNTIDELERTKADKIDIENLESSEKDTLEKIEEIKNLKKQLQIFEEENNKLINNIKDLKGKTSESDDKIRKSSKELLEKNKEIASLNDELVSLKHDIETLEEKNNNAQRRIVDLSRELENLYDEK